MTKSISSVQSNASAEPGAAPVDVRVLLRTAGTQLANVTAIIDRTATELGIRYSLDVYSPTRIDEVVQTEDFVMLADSDPREIAGAMRALWTHRDDGDLLIYSRNSDDRGTRPKELRREAERYVDRYLARILTLDTTDVRSRNQLIRGTAARELVARGADLSDPIDTCVKAAIAGWQLKEILRPFWPLPAAFPTVPSRPSVSKIKGYWANRNGIDSADYDMRAFNSRIALQRVWQRRRHAATYELVEPFVGRDVLNIGAGSGRLSLDLPGSVAVDIVHAKLRYMRRYATNHLVTASVFNLPFADAQFDCVVCCEVVEHVPRDPSPIAELIRTLRPGGRLVLSTPDYGTPVWPTIEKLYAAAQPKGYADEHITHYTEESLIAEVAKYGLRCVQLNKVFNSILVGAFEA